MKGRQVLDQNQFSNQRSIDDYNAQTQDLYSDHGSPGRGEEIP
ncbi:MAG: hypothetical protein ACLURV_09875 [Gallintestinimicrobium sp.]